MQIFSQFVCSFTITILFSWSLGIHASEFESDDAVVVEAEEKEAKVNSYRQGHQYLEYLPINWPYQVDHRNNPELPETATNSPIIDGVCTTSQGKLGNCTAFEDCNYLLNLKFSSERDEFDSHSNLKDETYEVSKNPNCSAVIYAGQSKYGNICCPFPAPTSGETETKPVFVNSLYADPTQYASKGCGVSKVPTTLKIVNGTSTVAGEFPWMVAIFGKSGKPTCGGSLISENMVLTAAHCINSYTATDIPKLRVHIGDWNIRSAADGPHETRRIKRIIKHKFFNIDTFVNDIALLRLDKPVQFTNKIQPICMPSGTRNLVNENLIVAGWGRTSFRGPTSPILLKVKVKVWEDARCNATYKGIAPAGILPTMICAGDPGLDSCVGDSGGPLMQQSSSVYHQIGIVSFGKGCGSFPGVYTKLTSFVTWIQANIKK